MLALFLKKHFEAIWIILSSSSFVGWLILAKDTAIGVVAFFMTILSGLYALEKYRKEKAERQLLEHELKQKLKQDE